MKKILGIVLASIISLSLATPAQANDLVVNCPNSEAYAVEDTSVECEFDQAVDGPLSETPLFKVEGMAPGETESQTFTINNLDTDEDCDLTMTVTGSTEDLVNLAGVIDAAIYTNEADIFGSHDSGVALLNQTLQDLYDQSSVDLGIIPADSSRVYTWLLTLDGERVGNDYQGLSTLFDIEVDFTCGDPTLTPTPTPIPADGGAATDTTAPTATPEPAEAPTCDIPDDFANAPTGFTAVGGTNSVSLSWDSYPNAVQYAIFFYNAAGDEFSVLGSTIGSATTATISNLAPGVWTFELVAVGGNENLCVSPRVATTATVGGAAVVGLPIGPGGEEVEEGEVLGVQENTEQTGETGGEVAGATTCATWTKYIPWILLLVQLAATTVSDYLQRRQQNWHKHALAFAAGLIPAVIFYLIRDCQCYSPQTILDWLCRWYWLAALLLFGLQRLINYGFIEVVDESR